MIFCLNSLVFACFVPCRYYILALAHNSGINLVFFVCVLLFAVVCCILAHNSFFFFLLLIFAIIIIVVAIIVVAIIVVACIIINIIISTTIIIDIISVCLCSFVSRSQQNTTTATTRTMTTATMKTNKQNRPCDDPSSWQVTRGELTKLLIKLLGSGCAQSMVDACFAQYSSFSSSSSFVELHDLVRWYFEQVLHIKRVCAAHICVQHALLRTFAPLEAWQFSGPTRHIHNATGTIMRKANNNNNNTNVLPYSVANVVAGAIQFDVDGGLIGSISIVPTLSFSLSSLFSNTKSSSSSLTTTKATTSVFSSISREILTDNDANCVVSLGKGFWEAKSKRQAVECGFTVALPLGFTNKQQQDDDNKTKTTSSALGYVVFSPNKSYFCQIYAETMELEILLRVGGNAVFGNPRDVVESPKNTLTTSIVSPTTTAATNAVKEQLSFSMTATTTCNTSDSLSSTATNNSYANTQSLSSARTSNMAPTIVPLTLNAASVYSTISKQQQLSILSKRDIRKRLSGPSPIVFKAPPPSSSSSSSSSSSLYKPTTTTTTFAPVAAGSNKDDKNKNKTAGSSSSTAATNNNNNKQASLAEAEEKKRQAAEAKQADKERKERERKDKEDAKFAARFFFLCCFCFVVVVFVSFPFYLCFCLFVCLVWLCRRFAEADRRALEKQLQTQAKEALAADKKNKPTGYCFNNHHFLCLFWPYCCMFNSQKNHATNNQINKQMNKQINNRTTRQERSTRRSKEKSRLDFFWIHSCCSQSASTKSCCCC